VLLGFLNFVPVAQHFCCRLLHLKFSFVNELPLNIGPFVPVFRYRKYENPELGKPELVMLVHC
jgi:hypothetical protein